MYLKGGQQVAKPDSESGLYIASRSGTVVKVSIPDDHIAYQVSWAAASGLHLSDAADGPAEIPPCCQADVPAHVPRHACSVCLIQEPCWMS